MSKSVESTASVSMTAKEAEYLANLPGSNDAPTHVLLTSRRLVRRLVAKGLAVEDSNLHFKRTALGDSVAGRGETK